MKIKISHWNGADMIAIKEVKIIDLLEDPPRELKWMKENNIQGNFEFIPENLAEKHLLYKMKMIDKK